MEKKQAEHIRFIREYLGFTRPAFAAWLSNLGVEGRESKIDGNKIYSTKAIEAWERGERTPPPKVLAAIRDNVKYEGERINQSYLEGKSDIISYSPTGIVRSMFSNTNNKELSDTEWQLASKADIENLANSPVNRFGLALYEDILPFLGYSRQDIIDPVYFIKYMQKNLKRIIDNYIELLSHDID